MRTGPADRSRWRKRNKRNRRRTKSPREENGSSSEDSEESGFQDAPTSNNEDAQLMLREYSQKRTCQLTSRLLWKMQNLPAREGGACLNRPSTSNNSLRADDPGPGAQSSPRGRTKGMASRLGLAQGPVLGIVAQRGLRAPASSRVRYGANPRTQAAENAARALVANAERRCRLPPEDKGAGQAGENG